jgi:hypothetical protein
MVVVSWAFYYTAPVYADVSNPTFNFCPNSVATIAEVSTDNAAGVMWSSSVFAPLAGGDVGIYFKDNGPGSITFASPSWSVRGATIPTAQATTIPLTPAGSSATFDDLGWGGSFGEGVDILGCTDFSNVSLSRGRQGTAHLDLSFFRGSTLYTVRVNVHLR